MGCACDQRRQPAITREAKAERSRLRADEAEAKEKALAEHVARHPEDVGRTVEDFNWIVDEIVRWPVR